MLHQRRDKLEEAIATLQDATVELELKLEDHTELTSRRRIILKKALDMKTAELEKKNAELQKVLDSISSVTKKEEQQRQNEEQKQHKEVEPTALFATSADHNDMSSVSDGRMTPRPNRS